MISRSSPSSPISSASRPRPNAASPRSVMKSASSASGVTKINSSRQGRAWASVQTSLRRRPMRRARRATRTIWTNATSRVRTATAIGNAIPARSNSGATTAVTSAAARIAEARLRETVRVARRFWFSSSRRIEAAASLPPSANSRKREGRIANTAASTADPYAASRVTARAPMSPIQLEGSTKWNQTPFFASQSGDHARRFVPD